MPYFITDKNADCSGWAVIDDAGEAYGCHQTKQDAIDQAVAISISDDEPFEGERAAVGSLAVGDYVSWNVLDPEIVAQVEAVEKDFAIVRIFEEDDGIFEATDKLMIMNVFKLEKIPAPEMLAVEVEDPEDMPDPMAEMESASELRELNVPAPAYMQAAARRGLRYYEDGQGGDGLVPATIREAREMAEGRVSDNKWVRISAWIARHLVDLDAPQNSDESDSGYPGAGLVAHLLWGSGPTKRQALRAKDFADSVIARLEADGERKIMTEVIDQRKKWLSAAHAIKAHIEGGTPEARDLGKSEKRVHVTDLEVREDGDGMTFEGYAAVFNSDSEPLPFIERIQPGAFRKSLQSRNEIKLLWNHDAGEPLASVRGGTLKLWEDATGLRAWARIANTTRGRDVAELIRSGTIDSMSFGFNVIKDSWSDDGNVRTLEQVRVFEISLVAFPAYTATAGTVSVREQRNIDADKLADSLARLEYGEELDADQADLIKTVVDKLTNKPEPIEDATPDNGLGLLEIQQLKLKLLEKGI